MPGFCPSGIGRGRVLLCRRMSPAELIPLVLKAAIVAIVFSIGMSANWSDVTSLVRQPSKLGRSFLAMNVIMPLFAVAAIQILGLHHTPVAIALVALALSPVPPLLPKKEAKAGGDASYAVGLLAVASLFSIIWIPVAIELIERFSGAPLAVAPMAVAQIVGVLILLPLVAGMAVNRFSKSVAKRIEPLLSRVAGIVLLIAVALIVVSAWPVAMALIGDGTVAVFVAFIVVGLAAGHLLGGPRPDERTVLALSTAARHPGIALAIAQLNFPEEKTVMGAVLLYLLLNAMISLPYVAWRKKLAAAPKTPHLAG
jgi:bile acid:Na+ symporter, BASS family